jgi:Transposase IS116/IS110/IS902 family
VEVVAAIQALRGVALIAAITLVAEIGNFHRFVSTRDVMAYLRLASSERSSDTKTLRGGITKAGNSRARRGFVEGAWTYRLPARIGADPRAQREPPTADQGHRLEGSGAPLRETSAARSRRQASQRRQRRHRAGTRSFRVAIATNEHVAHADTIIASKKRRTNASSIDTAAHRLGAKGTARAVLDVILGR